MSQEVPSQTIRLRWGDCMEVMAGLSESSLGSIVCDPPYGLEFGMKSWDKLDWTDGGGMATVGLGGRNIPWPSHSGTGAAGTANATCATCGGRMRGANTCSCDAPEWRVRGEPLDKGANAKRMHAQQGWHLQWLQEAHRVLVPGGIIKVFGGTRVFHRVTAAMEDAGFISIHIEAWAHATGYPKSHNVAVYMDRILTEGRCRRIVRKGVGNLNGRFAETRVSQSKTHTITTPEALPWVGWGTSLKPAYEPVVVGRKMGIVAPPGEVVS